MDELKPCPFCGCHVRDIVSQSGSRHTIKCPDCPGTMEFYSSTYDQACERWNTRALQSQPTVERDAERIDWLEENVSAIRDIGWLGGSIRAAIDAAINAKEG